MSKYCYLYPVSFDIFKFILIYLKVFSNFSVTHGFFRSELLVVYICVNFPSFFLLLIPDFNSLPSEQHTLHGFNHFKFTAAWFMDEHVVSQKTFHVPMMFIG